MASTTTTENHVPPSEDRRAHARRKVDDLAYVSCGPDNGGILLDISEGGLGFQGVGSLSDGKTLELRFMLPGLSSPIETSGELAWSTDSKRGGGLRFVDLDDG